MRWLKARRAEVSVKQLNNAQLAKALESRRFSEQSHEIAKRMLVDGWSVHQVVTKYKITRSRAFKIRQDVLEAHMAVSNYPKGWISATVVGPPDEIRKFQAKLDKLLKIYRDFEAGVAKLKDEG